MAEKMTMRGIGKKAEVILVPVFIVELLLTVVFDKIFRISLIDSRLILVMGILLLCIGLILHVISAVHMLKAFKGEKLETQGAFKYSRNPMYATQIFGILPGIALLFNSWLMLSIPVIMYIIVKIYIFKEEEYLEEKFGMEYTEYKSKTGMLFPKLF